MHFNILSITIPLCLLLNQILFSVATTKSSVLYHPIDNIAVNCGSSSNSTAVDGRQWTGDIGSSYAPLLHSNKGKLISSKATSPPLSPDPVPYMSARLSCWPFTYAFRVSPGQKFIRLHFYPATYRGGFKRSKAFFTVKTGPYTLLSNFSASLIADASGLDSLVKEYCVNVEENQPLIITFSPYSLGGSSDEAYAFVNGIEIVSMPAGLYHTQEGDAGAHVVGQNFRLPIDKSIALEMVHRFNVGGTAISSIEDTGLFRDWSQDSNFLMETSYVQPVTTTLRIKYTSIPSYTAPQKVYQTSWSMATDRQQNGNFNFTWKLPIDFGFRYLLRLHFCDFEYEIEERDRTKFSVFFDEHVAEAKADIIKWSGGNRVAVYRDYVVRIEGDRMEGKHDLLIAYFPQNHEWIEDIDTVLKGLEVFKLSNPDKNLAGVNPVPLSSASTSSNTKPQKFVYLSGGNALATVLVILLTFTNISVYMLRVWVEKFGEKNISPLPPEGLCRRFSLSEVLLVTNNFSHEFFIGSGGFGNVYKAHIDDGTTTVAIKRLNSKSKQGADEFRTEIEMLSNLRHTHLVSLIGYCDERQEMILVYEYMEHGTLADHLYKHYTFGNGTICHLSWDQRMKVCIGAARGLDYLHTSTRCGIIHRDIKTTNILLDKDWVAKISDFGLCKEGTTSHSHTHVSTDVKGTFGYLDPEYFLTRRLTKKSDVYAFGVVLLEVLCGRQSLDLSLVEEQRSLAWWAQQCIKEEKYDQLIDPKLRDQISPQCLKVFTEVANKCLHKHSSGRPTMTDVVASLECMLASQEQPKNACIEEGEEEKGVEEEEDVNVHGDPNQLIYYNDMNKQQTEIFPQGIVASSSTPVQLNDNTHPHGIVASSSTPVQLNGDTQRQKRSRKNLSQRVSVFLAGVMGIRSMGIDDVEIRTTATNDSTSQDESNSTGNSQISSSNSTGNWQISSSNSTGNWQISSGSDTDMPYLDGRILPTPNFRIFSFSELRNATKNFRIDNLLGEGRFGTVYKGWLDAKVTSKNGSGIAVAIKRVDYRYEGPLLGSVFEILLSDVSFLGRLSHSNLVKILGYCWEDPKLFLVYEFMQKGSLDQHLFGRASAVQSLPWDIRLKILIGAARGLAFLHALDDPVICREFSASNILLDGSFNSKISDFNYLELDSPKSWRPCGYVPPRLTGFYGPCIAPEYVATGHVHLKGDVYSFGVVLLEMLTGLRAYDTNRPLLQHNLVDWVKPYLDNRRTLASVIDPRLKGRYPMEAALRIAHLALHCLEDKPKTRPSMEQVVETLESISASQGKRFDRPPPRRNQLEAFRYFLMSNSLPFLYAL
ncbi:receptor-like protein kinase FERONIA isoform X2 [Rhododendron vialii]|uniref:receptor-like protein kinase FERONIA isoform X2 n=1 Tax=Rhododendron vialii TaxID=182163 RepID=UPI00265F0AFF|nr:receptor-like protein kinase FERONIA isoform X2 [Rhododendron vialii]